MLLLSVLFGEKAANDAMSFSKKDVQEKFKRHCSFLLPNTEWFVAICVRACQVGNALGF